jgi:hypothetical protein
VVEEEAEEVVREVVVSGDVPPGPAAGVAAEAVEEVVAEVEDAGEAARRAERVLAAQRGRQEGGEVVGLPLARDVALAEADVRLQRDPADRGRAVHPEPDVGLAPAEGAALPAGQLERETPALPALERAEHRGEGGPGDEGVEVHAGPPRAAAGS